MAEVTRVPLQPVKKGSLAKLWLGVVLAVLLGAGFAWLTVPATVSVEEITPGAGPNPTRSDVVVVNYTGKLTDGKVFDQAQGAAFPLGQGMISGFVDGIVQMQKGGKYKLTIPAAKAYGAEEKSDPMTGEVRIPANSDLVFDIEVVEFMSEEDYMRRMQMMQQLQQMQMQQQQQGGGGGAAEEMMGPPPPQQ